MYSEIIFFLLVIVDIAAFYFVYALRDIVNVVVSLSIAFLANSLLFLALNQPLLAAVQLFVMIGGISTYMFVGVATSGAAQKLRTRRAILIPMAVIIFLALSYPFLGAAATDVQPGQITVQQISAQMSSSIPYFYLIALLTFGATTGAIILLKSGDKKR